MSFAPRDKKQRRVERKRKKTVKEAFTDVLLCPTS
jgi:hypothetical protein